MVVVVAVVAVCDTTRIHAQIVSLLKCSSNFRDYSAFSANYVALVTVTVLDSHTYSKPPPNQTQPIHDTSARTPTHLVLQR